ncbi:MAG: MBL fold metallo-hydrolase [Desulfotalea sp.]
MANIKVKFWGVRGSIPCPGPNTQKYGGNSSCIEFRFGEEDRLVVLDAGSGIRQLGNHLMATDFSKGPFSFDLFLSHTHWDHIMGFPFFTPIYIPTSKIQVYGPVSFEDEPLEDVVGGQMKYRYFPINVGELSSNIKYNRIKEDPHIDMGDGLIVATKIINHPVTSLGYKFQYNGKTVCTCYDTEPYRNLFITDPDDPEYDEMMAYEGDESATEQNTAIENFFAGVDVLIHDAQYTMEEYLKDKVGWGHTPIEHIIDAATRVGVKRLILFHHDPDRSDDVLDQFQQKYCQNLKSDIVIEFAREGLEIIL